MNMLQEGRLQLCLQEDTNSDTDIAVYADTFSCIFPFRLFFFFIAGGRGRWRAEVEWGGGR